MSPSLSHFSSIAPCYDCKDRAVGCHSTCDSYIEWSAGRSKIMQKITSNKTLYSLDKAREYKRSK